MSILSTVSGFSNVGNDLQIALTVAQANGVGGAQGAAGQNVLVPNVMSVEWRQTTTDLVHMQMDGPTLYASLPKGYEGSIEYHRSDGEVEGLISQIHENWLAGADPAVATLVCNVAGVNPGAFTFTGVALTLEEGGKWVGDDVTRCRIRFSASRMLAG